MARTKTNNVAAPGTDELLLLLAPERRSAILEEAVGSHLRRTVERAGSLGVFVETLKAHPHWKLFQKLPVSSLLQADVIHPDAEPTQAIVRPISTAVTPRFKSSKKFIRRTPEQIETIVGRVVGVIEKNPGLRSEQIARQLGGDAREIKDALARLRDEHKVKTTGIKRAMTYQLA